MVNNILYIIGTDEDPSLWMKSFEIVNLHGVSTKINLSSPVYLLSDLTISYFVFNSRLFQLRQKAMHQFKILQT